MAPDPFTGLLGHSRGLGLPPRPPLPSDSLGVAQFTATFGSLQSARQLAEGMLPERFCAMREVELPAERFDELFGARMMDFDALAALTPAPEDENCPPGHVPCLRLRCPRGETVLLASFRDEEWGRDVASVGFPCPSRDADARPWVTLDPELIGAFEEGYAPDDIDDVLGRVSQALGLELVCLWEDVRDGWPCGCSDFYVQREDGLVRAPGRVSEVLCDPRCADTRINVASVGQTVEVPDADITEHSGERNLVYRSALTPEDPEFP